MHQVPGDSAVSRRSAALYRLPRQRATAAPAPACKIALRAGRAPNECRAGRVAVGPIEGASMHKVAVIVGSIRKDSINKKLAGALAKLAEGKLAFETRAGSTTCRSSTRTTRRARRRRSRASRTQIAAADGVLFVTPEHNRSIPAALKNAIDWATRPARQSAFKGKVGAIIGTSRGAISHRGRAEPSAHHPRWPLAALLGAPGGLCAVQGRADRRRRQRHRRDDAEDSAGIRRQFREAGRGDGRRMRGKARRLSPDAHKTVPRSV